MILSEGFQPYDVHCLPSRRAFNHYFELHSIDSLESYRGAFVKKIERTSLLQGFETLISGPKAKKVEISDRLTRVLGRNITWNIDQTSQMGAFVRIGEPESNSPMDSVGEGIVSLFTMFVYLELSAPNALVAIDEPELSLHPTIAKRLSIELAALAKERQIVVATHSPYILEVDSILNGAALARIHKSNVGSIISNLDSAGREAIQSLGSKNWNNPHVLGVNAKEVLFSEDGIVVFEGSDDVQLFPILAECVGIDCKYSAFGWGAGGASNIIKVCRILKSLGFKKVMGLYDKGKEPEMQSAIGEFPGFRFDILPAADIRTKKARAATDAVNGVLDESRKIRPEYVEPVSRIMNSMKSYFMTA